MKQLVGRLTLSYFLSFLILISNGSSLAKADERNSDLKVSDELLINKTDEIIRQYTDPGWFSGSVVIFKADKVIYDKSFGYADIENKIKNTSATKIRIGSINKHYTAALVLQKIQSGKLSLDDNLAKFELGFAKNMAEKITIRQLLQHTSGFGDIFIDEYFKSYRELKSINDKLPLLINKPLISEPGKKYNYSNYGYIVLGAILEKIEGKPFQSIINENILNVIKAVNTRYALTENVKDKARSYHFTAMGEKIDRTNSLENITPDGGMYSTPYDIALFYSKLFYSNALLNDESKAMMGNAYKDSARTWSDILKSDKAQWSSYGGGPGVSAAAEILIKDKLMVIALANTDQVVAERISQRIVDVYRGKEYEKIVLPLALFSKKLLDKKGDKYFLENAKNEFAQAGYENYDAIPLNKLGFALINDNQLNQAITVFLTNSKIFPKEPNVYDSLALAYEKAGNTSKALLNYEKALSLDSDFDSAKKGIVRLSQ